MAAPLSRSSSPSWTFDFAAENFIAPTAHMTSRGNLVPVLRKTLFEPSTYFNGGSRKDCALKGLAEEMRIVLVSAAAAGFHVDVGVLYLEPGLLQALNIIDLRASEHLCVRLPGKNLEPANILYHVRFARRL